MIKASPLLPFDRVEAARVRAGLSQKDLCRKAGLAHNTLAMASTRNKALKVETLTALAKALGIPLSELLGEAPPAAATHPLPAVPDTDRIMVSYSALKPSELNPRKTFDPEKLDELASSIEQRGLQHNLVVRRGFGGKRGDDFRSVDGTYEIVEGERRWRAIGLLVNAGKWDKDAAIIPCKLVDITDPDHIELALMENIQREDLPPLEEAEGYAQLQKIDPRRWTAGEIARQIGKTARHVQLRLALITRLHPKAQELLRDGKVSLAQARALTLGPKDEQKRMLEYISSGNHHYAQPEQIRESMLRNMIPVKRAVFPLKDCKLEIFKDEDTGAEYFTDRAGFLREQKKAAYKMAVDLKSEWKWVKVVEWFPPYDYEKAADKAKGGCVIVLSHDGTVILKKNLVKKGSSDAAKPKDKAPGVSTKEIAAQIDAGDAMAEAFGTAVREDFVDALRLYLLCSLGDYQSDMPTVSMDDVGIRKEVIDGTGLRVLKRFLEPSGVCFMLKRDADVAAAWSALRGLETLPVLETFAQHIGKGLAVDFGAGNTWILAQAMGLKLKPEHAATWRKALAGKVPGIQLDLEDAKPAKKKAAA